MTLPQSLPCGSDSPLSEGALAGTSTQGIATAVCALPRNDREFGVRNDRGMGHMNSHLKKGGNGGMMGGKNICIAKCGKESL